MLGVEVGRVDRLLQVHAAIEVPDEDVQRRLLLLIAAGCSVHEPRLAASQREAGRESVVRGRVRGSSDDGSPSSSQNISARVPSGQPSDGITGEVCSQPPELVAEKVAEPVGDIQVDGVAPRRLADPERHDPIGSVVRRETAEGRGAILSTRGR